MLLILSKPKGVLAFVFNSDANAIVRHLLPCTGPVPVPPLDDISCLPGRRLPGDANREVWLARDRRKKMLRREAHRSAQSAARR